MRNSTLLKTTLFWSFGLLSLAYSLPSQAISIPRAEIPTGHSVTVTNDYEQNRRYVNNNNHNEQYFERFEDLWLRQLIHVANNKRLTDNDEWLLWMPMHKTSKGSRANGGRQYNKGAMQGVMVRYYLADGSPELLPVKEDEPVKLNEKQTKTVKSISTGNSFYQSIIELATARDYPLQEKINLDSEKVKKYLVGDQGTIQLNRVQRMWEKDIAEFEVTTTFNKANNPDIREQDRQCKLFFWVLATSGHPVYLSMTCKNTVTNNKNITFHSIEYLSRAFSYSHLTISTLAPKPFPALQPNGELLGMAFSDKLDQLVFLSSEFNTNTNWLTFWDIHQRKAINTIKAVGETLHMTRDQQSIYSLSDSRFISGWRKISNQYKEFGSIAAPDFKKDRKFISSSLLGVYPVTLNQQNEIEIWNPGYGQRLFRKKLKHSEPEHISVADNGRLVSMDSNGNVYLHQLTIDASGCKTDIYKSYCDKPEISFHESPDKISIDIQLARRHINKEKARIKYISLHPSQPVIGYCSEHPSVCGLINYDKKKHVALQTGANFNFTDDDKVITDNAVYDLTGTLVSQFSDYHSYYNGSAISQKHRLIFNNQPNYDNILDKQIMVRDATDGSVIDTIKRHVYPVSSLAAIDSNTLIFTNGTYASTQSHVLDLANLQIQNLPLQLVVTAIDTNADWMFIRSQNISFVSPKQNPDNPILLKFTIGDYVLLDKYLVYVRDNAIYQLSLESRKTKKLYSFKSPVHEIAVFDQTGKKLAARLNRGVIALPHVKKELDLPFYGAEALTSMHYDKTTNSLFVSGLKGYSRLFNPGIEVIQQFTPAGEPILAMEPTWNNSHVMATTKNGQLWSGSKDGGLVIRDIASGLILEEIEAHKGQITGITQLDKNTMVTASSDGTIKLWRTDIANGKFKNNQQGVLFDTFVDRDIAKREPKLVATLIVDNDGEFIINSADGYYWSTPRFLHHASFLNGNEIFDYTKYDFWLNRPDIIISRLQKGSNESMKLWQKMVSFRQARNPEKTEILPLTAKVPALSLNGPRGVVKNEAVTLNYQVEKNNSNNMSLHVLVNQIQVFGTHGMPLDNDNGNIKLELTPGVNRIKAYVTTSNGLQSESQFLTYNKPASDQKPELYLLTIGVSDYKNNNLDLNYASKDAKDIANLLTNSQQFSNIHSITLLDTEVTTDTVIKAKQFLMQSKPGDSVLVFFAGHGFLDDDNNYFFGTTDIDPDNPGDKGLAYSHITNLLDGIPSRQKLLMLDTCHSGEVVEQPKNITLAKNVSARGITIKRRTSNKNSLNLSFELLQKTFVDLRSATGTIVISAAGGQEYALETPSLKNGVFTASVIKALKTKAADTNKDGQVSISELRNFTYHEVSRLTRGAQKPTTRNNNLDINFSIY